MKQTTLDVIDFWRKHEGQVVLLTWFGQPGYDIPVKVYEVVEDPVRGTRLIGYIIGERVLNIAPESVIAHGVE